MDSSSLLLDWRGKESASRMIIMIHQGEVFFEAKRSILLERSSGV